MQIQQALASCFRRRWKTTKVSNFWQRASIHFFHGQVLQGLVTSRENKIDLQVSQLNALRTLVCCFEIFFFLPPFFFYFSFSLKRDAITGAEKQVGSQGEWVLGPTKTSEAPNKTPSPRRGNSNPMDGTGTPLPKVFLPTLSPIKPSLFLELPEPNRLDFCTFCVLLVFALCFSISMWCQAALFSGKQCCHCLVHVQLLPQSQENFILPLSYSLPE